MVPTPSFEDFMQYIQKPGSGIYGKDLTYESRRTDSRVASQNLMTYIGGGGTWTAGHIDHAGTIGHNLMAWAEQAYPSDYEEVKKLWKKADREFEKENYFAALAVMTKARSKFFILEQKVGDFVVIPALACHQVYNKGKVTVKIAWNRITPDCLEKSIKDVLPRYR
ncbi:hypothetical protein BGZ81_001199, partial [Podila clonocystis]